MRTYEDLPVAIAEGLLGARRLRFPRLRAAMKASAGQMGRMVDGKRRLRRDFCGTLPKLAGTVGLFRSLSFEPAASYNDNPVPEALFPQKPR